LKHVLRTGPIKPGEVVEMAKEEGFSKAAVYRAKRALGTFVKSTEGRQSPDNMWDANE
jgi:hypothetical protein